MLNENLFGLDNVNSNSEFDIELFPFFNEYSFNFEKSDLFLPSNPNHFQNINQEIDFEGIKNIKEYYDWEKHIEIDKNNNQKDIQSTGSTQKLFSLKNKTIMENKEDININNESKINFKVVLHHKSGRKKSDKNFLNQKYHFSDEFDNILRKIQVSFITFLIKLSNDTLNTVFGKETSYLFKDIIISLKKRLIILILNI